MADSSTNAPVAIRHLSLPRSILSKPAIGASLSAIAGLMGGAHKMAYVAPYTSFRRQPETVPDKDLEGRDPDW